MCGTANWERETERYGSAAAVLDLPIEEVALETYGTRGSYQVKTTGAPRTACSRPKRADRVESFRNLEKSNARAAKGSERSIGCFYVGVREVHGPTHMGKKG